MSVPGTAAQQVERQAIEILDRAARGTRTGTFSVAHLGPRLASTVVTVALSSQAGEQAYLRFVRASLNFERRRDQASQLKLAIRVLQLDELVGKVGLRADEAAAFRQEIQHYLLAVQQVDEEAVTAAEKIMSAIRGTGGLRPTAKGIDIARETLSAKVRVSFLDLVASLSHSGARPSAADTKFLVAYRKLSKVMGADVGGGWKQAIEYLIENAPAVKAYRQELERLEAVIAKETDPAKLAHLRNKAFESVRKSGVHSKLKGLLGELYISRWGDWRLIKSSYMETAKRLANQMGSDWTAVPVAGRMFLGGAEAWDEAILLVRTGSNPPEAKLYMAAQFKVALEPTALEQTLNDIIREEAKKDLRVILADGREEWYIVTPLPPGTVSQRWVSNAAGGEFPLSDILELFERQVQVHQITMPIAVDEFNLIADRLLKACADLF